MNYSKIQNIELDRKVSETISSLSQAMFQITRERRGGTLRIQFFRRERRATFFGWIPSENRVVWEEWKVSVASVKNLVKVGEREDVEEGRQAAILASAERLRQVMDEVYIVANKDVDHIPSSSSSSSSTAPLPTRPPHSSSSPPSSPLDSQPSFEVDMICSGPEDSGLVGEEESSNTLEKMITTSSRLT